MGYVGWYFTPNITFCIMQKKIEPGGLEVKTQFRSKYIEFCVYQYK